MDFFSAGGFQQLFSDLDEQLDMTAETTSYDIEMNDASVYGQVERTTLVETYNSSDSSTSNDIASSDLQYANLNSLSEQASDMKGAITNDCNNNKNSTANLNQQLEHCLDYLLPIHDNADDDDDDDILNNAKFRGATETCLIQEVAEWEAQFLDNYIEIPELIDFLPEKTPLCTDTCELFLQESSKNLRLFRKTHRTKKCKSSILTTADLATMKGYPCNFGSCQKIYAKPAHLKAHLRRHLGEKPYICTWPECTWKFSRSDELARHRRSHSGVKPYKCDYCTKCFARSDHLAKHRKVHERRLLAASKAGCTADGSAAVLPSSVFNVRPGRKRKNQIC